MIVRQVVDTVLGGQRSPGLLTMIVVPTPQVRVAVVALFASLFVGDTVDKERDHYNKRMLQLEQACVHYTSWRCVRMAWEPADPGDVGVAGGGYVRVPHGGIGEPSIGAIHVHHDVGVVPNVPAPAGPRGDLSADKPVKPQVLPPTPDALAPASRPAPHADRARILVAQPSAASTKPRKSETKRTHKHAAITDRCKRTETLTGRKDVDEPTKKRCRTGTGSTTACRDNTDHHVSEEAKWVHRRGPVGKLEYLQYRLSELKKGRLTEATFLEEKAVDMATLGCQVLVHQPMADQDELVRQLWCEHSIVYDHALEALQDSIFLAKADLQAAAPSRRSHE